MSFDVWNCIHVFCVQPKRQKQMLQFKFTVFYYHKRKGQIRSRKTHLDTVLISLLFFAPSPASFFHINLAGWLCFATTIACYVYQPYSSLVPFCIPKITSFYQPIELILKIKPDVSSWSIFWVLYWKYLIGFWLESRHLNY